MTNQLTAISKLINSKSFNVFIDVICKKKMGKSLAEVEANDQIAAEKILDQWGLEKPYWLQMEAHRIKTQYANLGAVLTKAAPRIADPESKIVDDNDFFSNIIEHCKDISNEEMQELIAKIIAGEYNAPETHSVATLQVLKSLDKKNIKQFEHICSFLVYSRELPVYFFNSSDDLEVLFAQFNTSYNILQSLQSIGLFMSNSSVRQHRYKSDRNPVIQYFKETLVFEPNQQSPAPNSVKYQSTYALSQVGVEIMQYLQPKFNSEYFDWLKQNYKIAGFKLIKPLE